MTLTGRQFPTAVEIRAVQSRARVYDQQAESVLNNEGVKMVQRF